MTLPSTHSTIMDDNSPERTIDVFFYGLYMDPDVLASKGVKARAPRQAVVHDYALRIGQRATLLRERGRRAYGMLFAMTHEEIQTLYAGIEAYRPEPVLAHQLDGDLVVALCMNLLEPPAREEGNPDYAARLRTVLAKLQFPPGYAQSVA